MKIYHFTIIFAVFAALMLTMTDLMVSANIHVSENTSFLDEACDRAADSAAAVLAMAGESGVYGVREAAVDAYYESLSASLNVAGYANSRSVLRLYVPLLLITDETGTFVCYDEYAEDISGSTSIERKWSDNLAGTDIESVLQEYCDLHNSVARRAGVKYEFRLPEDEGGMYLRSSEGTGFYALFQGYPIQGPEKGTYNRFSFAGTGLRLAENYYINLKGTGYASPMYFHRENCGYRSDESTVYTERRECAEAGVYECPVCGGDGY